MRFLIAPILCLVIVFSALAGDGSYKLTYDGGSVTALKTGAHTKLYLDQNQIRIVKDDRDVLMIPASSVTEISYGQDVHRRIGAVIADN